MKNSSILVIILIVAILSALSYYLFVVYLPKLKTKPGDVPPPDNTPPVITLPSVIGKTIYAAQDGVKVLNDDGSTYKTAKENEWIGTVISQENRGGSQFYKVSGSRYVAVNLVTMAV